MWTAWISMIGVLSSPSSTTLSFPSQRIVVDVGCGRGFSTYQVSKGIQSASTIIGIDPHVSHLMEATRLVQKDPRVFFLRSTFEEFAKVCRPGTIDYLNLHYCLSDRSFPEIEDIIQDIDYVLSPSGMVDIQDYTRQFIYTELQDEPSLDPCFDWSSIKNAFSNYKCIDMDYPSRSSQRFVFRKKSFSSQKA